jgi:hypothetical protein
MRSSVAFQQEVGRRGIVFRPLALEMLGVWHPVAVEEVNKLAVALACQTGEDEKEATRHLWQRLGLQLQRGNSMMFTNRIPTIDGAE